MKTIKYNATKGMNIKEKRTFLKELSDKAAELQESLLHQCETDEQRQAINALKTNQILLKYFYTTSEHQEFKSFKGWIKEGKVVREGESSFLLWGKPTEKDEDGKEKPIAEDEEGNLFYPLSFIFSNAQVQPLKAKKSA